MNLMMPGQLSSLSSPACFLAAIQFLTQSFAWGDLPIVGLLVLLEGVLSIDNALVLGILAERLPRSQRGRALLYGLGGSFLFRLIAIGLATYLLRWRIVKVAGGAYLLWIVIQHFFFEKKKTSRPSRSPGIKKTGDLRALPAESVGRKNFWAAVAVIELTDIAFAIDSILAAIALVGPLPPGYAPTAIHPKLWVIVLGGFIGVVLMRFAAVGFIKLLEKFPRFNMAAYLLVALIGLKLLADWYFNKPGGPHILDFHSPQSSAFWVFWGLMAACLLTGFLPKKTAAS